MTIMLELKDKYNVGNRLHRRDSVSTTNSEAYSYDGVNQIKSLSRSKLNADRSGVTSPSLSESWDYDATGNWLTYNNNSVVENRVHNTANEIQTSCAHDKNGNMTVLPGVTCKYDAWNRLVEVGNTIRYDYNGLNQRVRKTVNNVVATSFFNSQWQELESVTSNQTTSYIWGLRYIDDLVLHERGSEKLYSLADPNWNVVATVNSTGIVQERMKYDAFGKVTWMNAAFTAKANSAYAWNRTFTGQVLDNESGLMLYRNRYYHTGLGRFITRDPIGYGAGDISLYRYVRNRTITASDPLGLDIIRPIYPNPWPIAPGGFPSPYFDPIVDIPMPDYSPWEDDHWIDFFFDPKHFPLRSVPAHTAPAHGCNVDCEELCKRYSVHNCFSRCKNEQAKFNMWYNRNRDLLWTEPLPECPCRISKSGWGYWLAPSDKWEKPTTWLHGYHKGATACMRSKSNTKGHANQCCYDDKGNLITEGSGQGSSDVAPGGLLGGTVGKHKHEDMNPADWAEFLDGNQWGCFSRAYLNVRPQKIKGPHKCPGECPG